MSLGRGAKPGFGGGRRTGFWHCHLSGLNRYQEPRAAGGTAAGESLSDTASTSIGTLPKTSRVAHSANGQRRRKCDAIKCPLTSAEPSIRPDSRRVKRPAGQGHTCEFPREIQYPNRT